MLKIGIVCLVITGTAGAQAILHQGVAAASGTLAGALAGKAVSDTLDSTLKATDAAARTGAAPAGRSVQSRRNSSPTSLGKTEAAAPGPGAASSGSGDSGPFGNVELLESPMRGARQGGVSRSSSRARRGRQSRSGTTMANLFSFGAPASPSDGVAVKEPVQPPVHELTADEVRTVPVGADRPSVINQLGRPASSILIPETGGLREVLYYTSQGDMIAAVSVSPDGAVTEVRVKN